MGLPGRDEARDWVGRTVVDREGAELGPCTAVFADDATGAPEWLSVEVDGETAIIPVVDATGSGGRVTVTVTRAQAAAAPSVGATRDLSQTQEAELYRHYGIEYSREASESLLPSGTDETAPAAHGRRPAAVAGTLVGAAAVGAAAVVRARRVRVRRLSAQRTWTRRLWARRPWAPRPPTPAERAAQGVVVASVMAREGARHLAASAVPLATTAAALARRGTRRGGVQVRRAARTTTHAAAAATHSAMAATHSAAAAASRMRARVGV